MANKTFSDVFPNGSAIYTAMTENNLIQFFPDPFGWNLLYGVLYGRFGGCRITVQEDGEARWKARFAGILWQYGPAWYKSLQIQDTLRNMSEEDLVKGSFQVSTQALNPAQKPSASAVGIDMPIVDTINAQSTNQYRKNKTDAYSSLMFLLKTDVTEPFLKRFDPLFRKILPNVPCEECYER